MYAPYKVVLTPFSLSRPAYLSVSAGSIQHIHQVPYSIGWIRSSSAHYWGDRKAIALNTRRSTRPRRESPNPSQSRLTHTNREIHKSRYDLWHLVSRKGCLWCLILLFLLLHQPGMLTYADSKGWPLLGDPLTLFPLEQYAMNNGKSGIRIYDGIKTIAPLLWKEPLEKSLSFRPCACRQRKPRAHRSLRPLIIVIVTYPVLSTLFGPTSLGFHLKISICGSCSI